MNKILILGVFLFVSTLFSQTKYDVYTKEDVILKSREILVKQLGVREKTNKNDGPQVEAYLKSVNRVRGDAWCNAFQYWNYKAACDSLKYCYKYIPMFKSGVANDTYKYALKYGKKTEYKAEVDDFLIWKYSDSYKGHIARIIEVKKSGWVTTIEGNTALKKGESEREGGGVGLKKRNIYHPLSKMNVRGLVGVKPFKVPPAIVK